MLVWVERGERDLAIRGDGLTLAAVDGDRVTARRDARTGTARRHRQIAGWRRRSLQCERRHQPSVLVRTVIPGPLRIDRCCGGRHEIRRVLLQGTVRAQDHVIEPGRSVQTGQSSQRYRVEHGACIDGDRSGSGGCHCGGRAGSGAVLAEREREVVRDAAPCRERDSGVRHRLREIGGYCEDARAGLAVRKVLHVGGHIGRHRHAAGAHVFDQLILVAHGRVGPRAGQHVGHGIDDVAAAQPEERGNDRIANVRVGRVEPLDDHRAAFVHAAVPLVERDAAGGGR